VRIDRDTDALALENGKKVGFGSNEFDQITQNDKKIQTNNSV